MQPPVGHPTAPTRTTFRAALGLLAKRAILSAGMGLSARPLRYAEIEDKRGPKICQTAVVGVSRPGHSAGQRCFSHETAEQSLATCPTVEPPRETSPRRSWPTFFATVLLVAIGSLMATQESYFSLRTTVSALIRKYSPGGSAKRRQRRETFGRRWGDASGLSAGSCGGTCGAIAAGSKGRSRGICQSQAKLAGDSTDYYECAEHSGRAGWLARRDAKQHKPLNKATFLADRRWGP